MPQQLYNIFFSGKTVEGADLVKVKQNLAKIFNTGSEQLEYLFSGKSVKVKNGVDQETAIKYRVAFRNAGALVEIQSADPISKPSPTTNETQQNRQQPTDDAGMTLLPARTGSLIDCAPIVQPAPLPDISDLSLASPEKPLDESTPPPPLQIDISNLELSPAKTGTLEDCQIKRQPVKLPDISQLAIAEDKE
ncbi:hypothetical protein [Sedimenticola sp.]|uniref:hypothetical protein n=1 Tax=Sedimenticola sp. TaxID=1940285 RepID=UPI003D099CA8